MLAAFATPIPISALRPMLAFSPANCWALSSNRGEEKLTIGAAEGGIPPTLAPVVTSTEPVAYTDADAYLVVKLDLGTGLDVAEEDTGGSPAAGQVKVADMGRGVEFADFAGGEFTQLRDRGRAQRHVQRHVRRHVVNIFGLQADHSLAADPADRSDLRQQAVRQLGARFSRENLSAGGRGVGRQDETARTLRIAKHPGDPAADPTDPGVDDRRLDGHHSFCALCQEGPDLKQ